MNIAEKKTLALLSVPPILLGALGALRYGGDTTGEVINEFVGGALWGIAGEAAIFFLLSFVLKSR